MRQIRIPYSNISLYDLDDFLRKVIIHYTITNQQDTLLGINDIRLEDNACVFYTQKSSTLECKGLCENEIRVYFQHLFFAMELCDKIKLKTDICLERLRFSNSTHKGVYDPFDYAFTYKVRTSIDYTYQEYNDPYGDNDLSCVWQLGVCLEKLVTNSRNGVSAECGEFLSMFFKSPDERIRIDQIKTHPWFLTNMAPSYINRNNSISELDEVYIANKIDEYKNFIFNKMHNMRLA